MAVGGLLVAGLVVWALMRSVEPPVITPVPTAATTASTPSQTPGFITTAPPLSPSSYSIPANGAQEPDKAEVGRISAEDLHGRFSRGDVTIVDVRDAAAFAGGHIPGSLNIPMTTIQGQLDVLPKGKLIVTYCT